MCVLVGIYHLVYISNLHLSVFWIDNEKSVCGTYLISDEVQHDLSSMRAYPVFKKVDALPGAQHEAAIDDRY